MKSDEPEAPPAASGPAHKGTEAEDTPRLRLRSLKVHSFRDVRPGTELTFGNGFHLILGKNGSGKSTLLELLAAASRLDFRGPFFAETPFHIEASFEVGKVSLHAEVRRSFERQRVGSEEEGALSFPPLEDAEVIVRVEHPGAPLLRWLRVRSDEGMHIFTADPRRNEGNGQPVKLMGGVDALRLSLGTPLSFGAMVQIDNRSRVHPAVWNTFLRISEHPGTGAPFDEARGALHAMVEGSLNVIRGKRARSISPWLPPALDFDAQGEPIMRDLAEEPLLRAAVERLGYDGAKVYFGPGASVAGEAWSYTSPSFQFFRHGKPIRRHDQLSFGQQRLFSFAWYLACNPDLTIADELVNGLHLEWIDWCVKAIGDRQCFLTCQNPLLMDGVPFKSEEDLRRGIILCEVSRGPDGDTSELSWRQLDERESDVLVRALQQSRLDLLSDLLHALDLW
jgi:hypothetical protein